MSTTIRSALYDCTRLATIVPNIFAYNVRTLYNAKGLDPDARRKTIPTRQSVQKKESYHHGDLRTQLVIATRRLVEERGPDGFSISEACRTAGVSSAAPYRHFADKRDLLVATALDGMNRMRDELADSIVEQPQGTPDSIATLGDVYVAFAQREPGVFRLMFGLTKDHDKSDEIIDCGQACFGVLIGQVAAYFKVGPDDPEVQRASFELWTFVHGLAFLVIDDKVSDIPVPLSIPNLIRDATPRLLGDRT